MIYALDSNKENKLVNIFDNMVESRKSSNKFLCVSCRNDVTANKGKKRQYFSHKAEKSDFCPSLSSQKNPALHQAESIVHHLAKEIFSEAKQILIPSHKLSSEEKIDLNNKIFPAKNLLVKEKKYPIVPLSMKIEELLKQYGIKPDLACLIYDNQKEIPLIIEISVTHSCHDSPEKKDKIKDNKLNCVEIDLENLHEKFLNVRKLENNEIDPADLQQIEDQIRDVIKDKTRYELINLFSEERVVLEKELNDSYNKDLIKHNDSLISKRLENYKYVLSEDKLVEVKELEKEKVYSCICCSGSVTFNGESIVHSNCSYLHGYGIKKEDYNKKYLYLKIIEDLKNKKTIQFPNKKNFILSEDKVKSFKKLDSSLFDTRSVSYFNAEPYVIKEVTAIDNFSLFELNIEDSVDKRTLNLVFYLNLDSIFFDKKFKELGGLFKNTDKDYFICLDINELKYDYKEDVLFEALSFKNWEILKDYVAPKEIDYLTFQHINKLSQMLEKKEEEEKQIKQEFLKQQKENVESEIKLVLDEENQLIIKKYAYNNEKYFCVYCHSELTSLRHSHTNCGIFESLEYYNWAVNYYKTLNELKDIAGTTITIDKFIINFSPSDKVFLDPIIKKDGLPNIMIPNLTLYVNKVYENEGESIITVEASNKEKGHFKFHFDLNHGKKSEVFFSSLETRNYYINKTYRDVTKRYKKIDINECFLEPSLKEREDIIKKYSNAKIIKLEKEKEKLKQKESNKNNLQNILIAHKHKDLQQRVVLNKNSKDNLVRRLKAHKEKKLWEKKKYFHLLQLETSKKNNSVIIKNKLDNWKIFKSLSNKTLIIENTYEQKQINSGIPKLINYVDPKDFYINDNIKFKKITSTDQIKQLLNLAESINKEDKGFICVPFRELSSTLFNNSLNFLDINDVEVILNLNEKHKKHEYVLKKYYPYEYHYKNLKDKIDISSSISFFVENTELIKNIVKEDFSEILVNTINYYETSKSNNCIIFLEHLEQEIFNNMNPEKIAKAIKFFCGNKEFDRIYQQYFEKYNLYSDVNEQKKLLDTLIYKPHEPIEVFLYACDNLNLRLSIEVLKKDYIENNTVKSLFMLSRKNIELKNFIKEEHLHLIDKFKQPNINRDIMLIIFPLKFGKLGFKK